MPDTTTIRVGRATRDELADSAARAHLTIADAAARASRLLRQEQLGRELAEPLSDGEADPLKGPTDVGTARSPDEEVALSSLIEKLLANAKESGPIRPDATLTDIRIMLCGAVLQLLRLDVRDRATWRRYGELVINTFHSPGSACPPTGTPAG